MQHKSLIRVWDSAIKKGWIRSVPIILGLVGIFFTASAFGADELSTMKETLKENFGPTSTIVMIIYLLEVLNAAYRFLKTRDLKEAGGILFMSLFLTFSFTYIVFKI